MSNSKSKDNLTNNSKTTIMSDLNSKKSKNKSKNKSSSIPKSLILKIQKEQDIIKQINEEEENRLRLIEEENKQEELRLKLIEEKKKIEKDKIKNKIKHKKEIGEYKTKKQREKELLKLKPINTTNIVNSSYTNENKEEIKEIEEIPIYNYRSLIISIMGHVDSGKTKIMDKIRNTNVQENEIGGITQQIGATFIDYNNIIKKTNVRSSIPGLLMIDTPGHEAFYNLRKRCSLYTDIVILVIDIFNGLEPQTIESIKLLVETNTKFIIALNKVDRLYGWNSVQNCSICDALETNKNLCIDEFNNKLNIIKCQLQENSINSELYWNNNSIEDTISICPISALTGEGISDLLNLIINFSENYLSDKITITDKLKCLVMEKTFVNDFGVTIDVLLISGTLNRGDNILIKTNNGLIKTQIRNILTIPSNCESRVTTNYNMNSTITGTIGIKIVASNLENIIVGSDIIIDNLNNEIINDDDIIISSNVNTSIQITNYNLENIGIGIHTSTEGSLEALIYHLQKEKIPISVTYIGKIMKKHINKMIISNKTDYKELNVILAFDVNIDDDALDFATKNGITILTDGTIYRLYAQYEKLKRDSENERKELNKHLVIYPCILNILKDKIFKRKDEFIFGVKVNEGSLHINTPLIVINKNSKLFIGKVISIHNSNSQSIDIANKGSEVCVKINAENNYIYGRHFDFNNILISNVTQSSIDVMKTHFKDEITNKDGKLNDTGKLLKLIKEMLK